MACACEIETASDEIHVDDEVFAKASPQPEGKGSPDSLGSYLRELGAVDLLDAAEEVRLSRQLRQARQAVHRLAARVPRECRDRVLEDLDVGKSAVDWSPREIETFCQRLGEEAGNRRQGTTATLFREARRHKRLHDEARRTMILANLKLVVHLAKRYAGCGVPLTDLIQEGNIGLLTAVDKFEPQRGNRFSTYAYWWIKQAVDRSIAVRGRLIRIPVHLGDQRRKIARTIADLKQLLRRDPNVEEIAARSGLPQSTVKRALRLIARPPGPEPIGGDAGDPLETLCDLTAPSPFRLAARNEMRSKVRSALRSLKPREAEIVRLRFGIGCTGAHTLEEIGESLQLSRERIRQIQSAAMKKLHGSAALEEFLNHSGISANLG